MNLRSATTKYSTVQCSSYSRSKGCLTCEINTMSRFLKAKRGFVFFQFSTRPNCSFHNRASALFVNLDRMMITSVVTMNPGRRSNDASDDGTCNGLIVLMARSAYELFCSFWVKKWSTLSRFSRRCTSMFRYSVPLSALNLTGFLPVRKRISCGGGGGGCGGGGCGDSSCGGGYT